MADELVTLNLRRALLGTALISYGCASLVGLDEDYYLARGISAGSAGDATGGKSQVAPGGSGPGAGGVPASPLGGEGGAEPAAGSSGAGAPTGGVPAMHGGEGGGPDPGPKPCSPACEAPTPICNDGTCVAPKSCDGLDEICGPSSASPCCEPVQLPSGTFNRSYDGVTATDPQFSAEVTSFALDRLEVTVGRFRAFVKASYGHQQSPPPEGAGALAENPDSGWKSSWNELMPANKEALVAALKCSAVFQTWSDEAGLLENRPINCVNWYDAAAFCIWDGGRLPTEAEWNYGASGANEHRVYPWSSPADDESIDPTKASYYVNGSLQCQGDGASNCVLADIRIVGSKSGLGRWGLADMAGNLSEWTLDYYNPSYLKPCDNCVQLTASTDRVVRGGDLASQALTLTAAARDLGAALVRTSDHGFRCAYGR